MTLSGRRAGWSLATWMTGLVLGGWSALGPEEARAQGCPPGQFCPGGQPPGAYGQPQYPQPQYPQPQYPQPQYPQPQYPPYGQPPYGQPQYPPPYGAYGPGYETKREATRGEKAYLYTTTAAFGVGTGIWLDVEAQIENPGLALIMPILFGVGFPMGVLIADVATEGLPEGLPAALSTGAWLGAGLGAGIWATQDALSGNGGEWGPAALGRSMIVGTVVGGIGGGLVGGFVEPSPRTSMLALSGTAWGTLAGAAFGGAASQGDWSTANDAVAVGSMVGYGVGLLGSAGLAFAWVPSWSQLGAMWAGFGIGSAATTPIYLVYLAVPDADPRTGLVAQGLGGLAGVVVGALVAPSAPSADSWSPNGTTGAPPFATLRSVSPGSVGATGYGVTASGELW